MSLLLPFVTGSEDARVARSEKMAVIRFEC